LDQKLFDPLRLGPPDGFTGQYPVEKERIGDGVIHDFGLAFD